MTVQFGVLGCGGISNRFASVLRTAEGAQLYASAARDISRAEAFSQKYGAQKAYGSYEELACDPNIDIVYIGLTHNFHYDAAKLCILAGKAVMCEKPFFITKREAEELYTLAKERGVLIMEAMWSRFVPAYVKAKEWIKGGKIGQVKYCDASFCYRIPFDPAHRLFDPALAGGSLFDAGVYPIEYISGMLEEHPIEITGVAQPCPTGVDEYAAMCMRFASGAVATLACGYTASSVRNARFFGTDGYVEVYDFLGARKCARFDEKGNMIEAFETSFEDGFIFEIRHIIELYKSGKKESDVIPMADTIACADAFDKLRNQWGMA